MSKKSRIALIIAFIALSLLVVTVGLYVSDALPQKVSYSITSFVSRLTGGRHSQTEPEIHTDEFIPTVNVDPSVGVSSLLPEKVVGVTLGLNTDVKMTASDSYAALYNEALIYYNDFKNYTVNTVFLKPDLEGRFENLKDAYGNAVDALRVYLSLAETDGLFRILIADRDLIVEEKGSLKLERLKFYLSNYAFNGVVFSCPDVSPEEYLSLFTQFSSTLRSLYGHELQIGACLDARQSAAFSNENITALLSDAALNFVEIEASSLRSSVNPFNIALSRWNAAAAYFRHIRIVCGHRNDLVLSGAYEWSNPTEIVDEMQALWDHEFINGSVFHSAETLLKNRSSMSLALSRFVFDGELPDLQITKINLYPEQSRVHFVGASASGHKMTLNGFSAGSGGEFNLIRDLYPGENPFRFESCGKTLSCNIYQVTPDLGNRYGYSDAVSPYVDNGLGTALMARIINDDTETLGAPNEKNTYHADNSTLPKETLDYVVNMDLTEAGFLRYQLKSGATVYGVNCELLSGAYVMPKNRVIVNSVNDVSPTSTDIIFDTDWFVPIRVVCSPQAYHFGYDSYSYNIDSFTAQYVDVYFHYSEFYNSAALSFGPTSPFSRSELYATGEDTIILRLYLKKTGQFYGFDIRRTDDKKLVLSFKKHSDGLLAGKTVMLDPGHGGLYMTGTALTNNTVAEKTVTLAIASKAKGMLEALGAKVIMTRVMDMSLTLEERTALLSKYNPDIFVSIHCDGTENVSDAGTHTFYFRPYSMPLAYSINAALSTIYKTYIYKPTDTNYPKIDKNIKFYPFFVTRLDQCPSVLVETGFMTNPDEGLILTQENTQYWLAQGITNGIQNYFAANY